uniref:Oligopeptide transport system permease protein OppB (TC 3.A.1.5.1) n=1 Tax=Nonomuraea gerenzanensis TaxID=93944 RepID=A0A1M4DVQ1_9ACTN|nr:Oligopeptide transport system permease protein OppB (TC 3.A.1.5.1) [Nonomuraea gerenzanensis]
MSMLRARLTSRLSRPGIHFTRLSPVTVISLAVLAAVALFAVLAPFLAGDPLATGTPATPPGGEHWLGTDRAGRDVFARIAYGARSSLLIGLGATALAVLAGAVLGSLAATSRKAVNEGIMRVLDVIMAFPGIALAAVLVAVFGRNLPVLIGTIAFLYVPQLTRVVRANVLAQYGEDYVAAEKVIGAPRPHILIRHVAVNCAAPVMVFATVLVADAIIFEASLSFIGAGIQDPAPSWGNVLAYGRQIVLSGGWWATFFPGLAILVTVLALNLLAEGLTDAWAAPRAARRTPAAGAADVTPRPAAAEADPGGRRRRRHAAARRGGGRRRAGEAGPPDAGAPVPRAAAVPASRAAAVRRGPVDPLPAALRGRSRRPGALLRRTRRRDARPGGGVRLRQEPHQLGDHGAAAPRRAGERPHRLRQPGHPSADAPRAAGDLRPADRHGLPGRHVVAEPLGPRRHPAPAAHQAGRHPYPGGTARTRRPGPAAHPAQLPARAVRRTAPARAHRDGAVTEPAPARRRRTHHRTRRDRAGPGRRAARQAPRRARLRHGAGLPRPRPGRAARAPHRRHVRRPARRDRHHRFTLHRRPAPLRAQPARLGALP